MPRLTLLCRVVACLVVTAATAHASATQADVEALSAKFWQWRATEQPFTNDDIPRLDRPHGFVAHWAAADVASYRSHAASFEQQWRALDVSHAPVGTQVDYRLIGSAIARVDWELDVLPVWRRNPFFYVDQGLTATYTLLLQHRAFTPEMQADVVARLASVPRLLDEGRINLTDMRQPYAIICMEHLAGIEDHMEQFKDGVHNAGNFEKKQLSDFDKAEGAAVKALVAYREWLRPQVDGLKQETAVGRDSYIWFLRNVALMSHTPEQIVQTGQLELDRAVAFEALQQAANKGLPDLPVFPAVAAQIADEEKQETAMRQYLQQHGILSDPEGVKHYHYVAVPPYIAALSFLGVDDDLTGPDRLGEEGSSYKGQPRTDGGFFSDITARDTRPLTIHEGAPGHYEQMAWAWHSPDPVRRHYYDSESQEGIGFYAEEMMLIAGEFDATPKVKEAIYRMMRLRALRVLVDVKLATGEFTLQQAADYLKSAVPMDEGTARSEAAMFSTTPGQAITYQVGKSDIMRGLTAAKLKHGDAFSLEKYQDYVWSNGSVPFSLQRWELLGDASGVPAIPDAFVKASQ